jgi:hypothetical protein
VIFRAVPALSIAALDAAKVEGSRGINAFTFTVTRSSDTSGAVSATWSVAGDGASPADGTDFADGRLPSGTVSFAAGETRQTITVEVAGGAVLRSASAAGHDA